MPVFPALAYGITPYFMAYPGTVSLRVETYVHVVRDILDSLHAHGFRRILIVNGHGGNQPAQSLADRMDGRQSGEHGEVPQLVERAEDLGEGAGDRSRSPRTPPGWRISRGRGSPASPQPTQQKPMIDLDRMRLMTPEEVRAYLGDGNFGGYYERSDEEMLAIWDVAVEETRDAARRRLVMAATADPDLGRRRHRRHARRRPRARRP